MPNPGLTPEEIRVAVEADAAHATKQAAADSIGISRGALNNRLKAAEYQAKQIGEIDPTLIETATGRSFILTSAQNQTAVFRPFWENLLKFAEYHDAEIKVARFRYNVSESQAKQEKTDSAAHSEDWYAGELTEYFSDTRVKLCDGLVWAGDMNILPTATDPLSGMDSFSGLDSCIFPHAKIALKSIAVAMEDPPKKNYTTGAVTLSNYIKRKAGQKAEFHHAYGALFVTIDDDGVPHCRHINADSDGAFYDLDVRVEGEITTGHRIAALTAADIHGRNADQSVVVATWGKGGLVDTLKPEKQFLHDILDFESRSHHNDLFDQYRLYCEGDDGVEQEISDTHAVISECLRDFCETFIIQANHDEHFGRWLKEGNFKADFLNAPFYLEAMAAMLRSIRDRNDDFNLLEWAFERFGGIEATFVPRNSVVDVCGVDHGSHGDMGPNGSRGSVRNLSKVGRKMNIGHSHSAHIVDGCYQCGTSSRLDMKYLKGPSSWSHAHIITYQNGKRAIIEIKDGKWR